MESIVYSALQSTFPALSEESEDSTVVFDAFVEEFAEVSLTDLADDERLLEQKLARCEQLMSDFALTDDPAEIAEFRTAVVDAVTKAAAENEEDSEEEAEGACENCGRVVPRTRHHLIPRDVHSKYARDFTKRQLAQCAMLCRPCHSAAHSFATNHDLAQYYNTVELLTAMPHMQRFAKWVGTQRTTTKIHVARSAIKGTRVR